VFDISKVGAINGVSRGHYKSGHLRRKSQWCTAQECRQWRSGRSWVEQPLNFIVATRNSLHSQDRIDCTRGRYGPQLHVVRSSQSSGDYNKDVKWEIIVTYGLSALTCCQHRPCIRSLTHYLSRVLVTLDSGPLRWTIWWTVVQCWSSSSDCCVISSLSIGI